MVKGMRGCMWRDGQFSDLDSSEPYQACDDLWVITSYFNPGRYRTRLTNYHLFADALHRAGLNLLTVECAFGDQPFQLPAGNRVIQRRSRHALWQKERLLNIAVSELPSHVSKVAWIDCDVLFASSQWAPQTSQLLDKFPIVQLFERAVYLPPGATWYDGAAEPADGFAYMQAQDPRALYQGYPYHGSTGLAWAAQRELLEKHGLYDAALAGNGDHLMAHAMVGDLAGFCVEIGTGLLARDIIMRQSPLRRFVDLLRRALPRMWKKRATRALGSRFINERFKQHFVAWGQAFYEDVRGQLGYTPGLALHLWHGRKENRQYRETQFKLHQHGFDPKRDLCVGPSGCWEWASDKPALHRWGKEFFQRRQEDG